MNSLGIRFARRKQVENQQVNPLPQGGRRFMNKVIQLGAAEFVSGRDDLNHRDDFVAAGMANDQRFPFERVLQRFVGFAPQCDLWRSIGNREATGRPAGFRRPIGITIG